MKNGKFAKRGSMVKKTLVLALAVVMLVGISVGGTIAWLTSKTPEIKNTFTTSDINITLTEEAGGQNKEFQMIPGWTIDKDPVVTVKAESEDCWLFIKVTEAGGNVTVDGQTYGFDDFIDYGIDPNNWEQLKDKDGTDVAGVYVYKWCHKKADGDSQIKVLGYQNGEEFIPNKVLVKDTVTKEMMDALDGNNPTLTFTAYASQYWQDNDTPFTAYEAWENCPKGTN